MGTYYRNTISSTMILASMITAMFLSGVYYARSECSPVTTQADFNLVSFIESRWYIHEQAVTKYLPAERFYCITADYKEFDTPSFWGYTIDVFNNAQDVEGMNYGGNLCAKDDDSGDPGKLKVAPCFLPASVAGPYWVLAYDEAKGYALVVGGQPTEETKDGFCIPKNDVTESGLWIFLRSPERNEDLIQEARNIATSQKIDTSILFQVSQTNCTYPHIQTV